MVDAVTMDGEPLVFAIGGWGPVFQLGRWHELGSFPVFQKIVEIPSKTPGYRAAFRFVNA